MQIRKIWIKRVSSGNIDSNTEIMCEKPMTTNVSSTTTRPSTSAPTTASRRNISPRPPTTLSSSSSTERGMDDKDVRRIMGITQEATCSTRYRIIRHLVSKCGAQSVEYIEVSTILIEWQNSEYYMG